MILFLLDDITEVTSKFLNSVLLPILRPLMFTLFPSKTLNSYLNILFQCMIVCRLRQQLAELSCRDSVFIFPTGRGEIHLMIVLQSFYELLIASSKFFSLKSSSFSCPPTINAANWIWRLVVESVHSWDHSGALASFIAVRVSPIFSTMRLVVILTGAVCNI